MRKQLNEIRPGGSSLSGKEKNNTEESENMSKRNVVVFGATGEIGGRIANLAAAAGHHVCGVTRGRQTAETVSLEGVELLKGDKNDEDFLRSLAASRHFDVIIDTVPWKETADRYMRCFPDVENVFVCSSTGTFVPLRYFPADETHPWREKTAFNFYEQSCWDARFLELFETKQFPITIFRPTNIIGEGRIPLELWGGRNIEFFRKLKANEPVTIAPCEEIMVQSGYNWDLASAFVLALDHPDEVRGEIFTISCKRAVTLGEYLKTAMEYLNSSSEILHAEPEKLTEIYPGVRMHYGLEFLLCHMCLDISKAQRVLGYAPKMTTQEGLVRALSWCEKTGLL